MGFEDSTERGEDTTDMDPPFSSSPRSGVMTFRELVDEVKGNLRAVAISVAAMVFIAVFYLWIVPIKYEAFVKIAPVQERESVSSGSKGLLSTIGLKVGSGDFTSFDHFLETLTSVKLAKRLERDEQLGKRIFKYDKEAKEFVRPKGPINLLSQFLNWVFGQPGWMPPQSHDLANYFKNRFEIEQDRDTEVITITYQNKSRSFAEELLSVSLRKTDEILREEEKALNTARHAYLEDRLQTEVRQTNRTLVAELLLDAEQKLMLVNVDPSYGARIVDGPTSSSRPASPRVLFSLIGAVVLGFMIGIGILVIRIMMRDVLR